MGNQPSIKGYIIFCNVETGSKSEHFAPLLFRAESSPVRLQKKGDNPFSHDSLKPFHLSYCEVIGEMNEKNSTFLVSEITKLPDPAQEFWSPNGNNSDEDETSL